MYIHLGIFRPHRIHLSPCHVITKSAVGIIVSRQINRARAAQTDQQNKGGDKVKASPRICNLSFHAVLLSSSHSHAYSVSDGYYPPASSVLGLLKSVVPGENPQTRRPPEEYRRPGSMRIKNLGRRKQGVIPQPCSIWGASASSGPPLN
jgi:hypothetical protein